MTNTAWAENLKRLATANARAHEKRLRSMTLQESLRRFEEHCRTVHAEFDRSPSRRTHPVGLIKYWKPS